MSNKSLAELEKRHAVIGWRAAITSETLQALRQHWEVSSLTGGGIVTYTPADALFQNKHVTSGGYFTSNRIPGG